MVTAAARLDENSGRSRNEDTERETTKTARSQVTHGTLGPKMPRAGKNAQHG